MACSLCRLPFAPKDATSWPLPGMLSSDQINYMKRVVAMGPYVPGVVATLVFSQDNLFMGNNSYSASALMSMYNGRTLIPMHPHCSTLFRHHAGLLDDQDAEVFVELSLLEKFIGFPMLGAHVGRLPDMDYEVVLGDGGNRLDINVLWSGGSQSRLHTFDWHEWKRRGLQWTAARPDVFPRFHPTLTPARQESARRPAAETSDILTTLPLDILHLILEHPALSNDSFVRVLGTCRTFRTHALTTFQPIARARVIALGWALPMPIEWITYIKRQNGGEAKNVPDGAWSIIRNSYLQQLPMPHAQFSPLYGDWLQYLEKAHRSQSMRARRWLWTLATRLAGVRAERRAASEYAEVEGEGGVLVRSKAWRARAQEIL